VVYKKQQNNMTADISCKQIEWYLLMLQRRPHFNYFLLPCTAVIIIIIISILIGNKFEEEEEEEDLLCIYR